MSPRKRRSSRRHPRRLGRVDPALQALEELTRGHLNSLGRRKRRDYKTGSGAKRRLARGDGKSRPRKIESAGTAAQAYIAVRRSTVSASAPSASAAIPPSPIEKPIEIPEASPIREGRYSWLITPVTPNVETTQTPTSASAAAPSQPPTATKATINGGAARSVAS